MPRIIRLFKVGKNNFLLIAFTFWLFLLFKAQPYCFAEPVSKRIFGENRIETAVKVSREFFTSGSVTTVVVAPAYDYSSNFLTNASPDAVCAVSLAGLYHSPLLLTKKEYLSSSVINEIKRLGAKTCIFVGGTSVISEQVLQSPALEGIYKVRIAGSDRFHTSALVAQKIWLETGKQPDTAIIVNGESLVDACMVSYLSYLQVPVLLVKKDQIPFPVRSAINSLNLSSAIIFGGTSVVSKNIESHFSSCLRIGGLNRVETSVKAFNFSVENCGFNTKAIFITGSNWLVDALIAGAPAANLSSPVVLVPSNPESACNQLRSLSLANYPESIFIIGGYSIVPESLENCLD